MQLLSARVCAVIAFLAGLACSFAATAQSDGYTCCNFHYDGDWISGAAGLPGWTTSAEIQGWERVTVPAGTFKALRVRVAGRRSAPIGGRNAFAGRFEMTAWYAPDVKRIVRQEQRIWTADGISPALSADEVFELLAYRPPS